MEPLRTLLWIAFSLSLSAANAQVRAAALPHFGFAAPTSWGWQQVDSNEPTSIVFTTQRDSAVYTITLLEQEALGGPTPRASAKEVAEHYIQAELDHMVEKGVKTGLYQLFGVERGEESIGGRLHYTMKYRTKGRTHYQTAALYLHFPRAEPREHFLVAHYSAVASAEELIAKPFEADFIAVLESLTHSPAGQSETAGMQTPRAISPGFEGTFQKVHALTQMGLPLDDLEVRCRRPADGGYVTLVAAKPGGILLAVFSSEPFDEPASVIRLSAPADGLPSGTTMDWAYVLDRTADGAVDYLAFLDGPAPVIPDDWTGEVPRLRGGISGKVLKEIVIPNVRLLFWHLADENFHRRHDHAVTSARNLENGWIDSWVVARDANFDGSYESCGVLDRRLRAELGPCAGDESGYRAPGRQLSGLPVVPPPPQNRFFELINQAAAGCGLSGADFREARQ